MANNTEAVGQLLATSALRQGEKELMRRPDEPPRETAKPAAQQQPAQPIAHDSKSTAAVLLALLEDRLLASHAETTSRNGASVDARRPVAGDEKSASQRITWWYADEGAIAVGEAQRPGMPFGDDRTRAPNATGNAAPDLQSFMQRLSALAAQDAEAIVSGERRYGGRHSAFSSAGNSGIRVMIIVLSILWLGIMIAGWGPR